MWSADPCFSWLSPEEGPGGTFFLDERRYIEGYELGVERTWHLSLLRIMVGKASVIAAVAFSAIASASSSSSGKKTCVVKKGFLFD
ncbi:hypothetical protein FRC12_006798 [Ceratobasidium sp. 428]|nr:hypothetical protein FRC12_006798 [Ceratobasidium sp. 428]